LILTASEPGFSQVKNLKKNAYPVYKANPEQANAIFSALKLL
jgi:hypothetical protein